MAAVEHFPSVADLRVQADFPHDLIDRGHRARADRRRSTSPATSSRSAPAAA